MQGEPLLSIVVTSYTAERLSDIFELLDSVAGQEYRNIEVIFVAERSLDLMEKVREYSRSSGMSNVTTMFNEGEVGLSAARNVGIGKASGHIIAFVDDDVVLFPDWAEEMVSSYNDGSIIGVTGPALPLWEHESMKWFPEQLYWILSCTAWCGWRETRDVRNAWGMNMSFAREAFDSGCYFYSSFGLCNSSRSGWRDPPSEDVDLSLRVRRKTGKRIIYNPAVRVKHHVYRHRLTARFIAQRACSVGYQRRVLKKLYRGYEEPGIFAQEQQLLWDIFGRLVPRTLTDFFTNPVTAWRKFSAITLVLSFGALGYCSQLFDRSHNEVRSPREVDT